MTARAASCRRLAAARPVRAALAALALVLLGACSSQLLYNRLDTLAYWYLSSQVSLDDEQSSSLRESLRELLAWHRRTELPRYAVLLDELARDASRGLTRERIDRASLEVVDLWKEIVRRATPDAAGLVVSLSDRQVDEFIERLAEDDARDRRKACDVDPDAARRRREKSLLDAVQDWTGRLTDSQRALVRATAAAIVPTQCDQIRNREAFRRELRALLARRDAGPAFEQALERFLANPEERWPPALRERIDANRQRIVAMLAELDRTLDPAQRARLAGRFATLAKEMRSLAGTPQAPARTAELR